MDPLSEIGTLDFVPWSGCGGSRLTCISCLVSPRREPGADNIGTRAALVVDGDDAFHCLSRAAPRTLREYGLTRNRCADRRAGLRAVPVGQPRRTVTHYPSAVRYRHTDWRHAAEFRTRVARILTN